MHLLRKYACTGHKAAVYALASGRSGNHIVSAGGDGWLVEWDLRNPETGRVLASVGTQVFSLFSFPGGARLVAGNMNGGVHWIDLEHPDRTRNIQHHKKGVYDILMAGEWLFTAGGDGVLTRWDPIEGRTIESFHLSNRALRCIGACPERAELAIGASDGNIYIVNTQTLALKYTLTAAHANSVFATICSPDGRFLLSGGRDAMLKVWDLENNGALVSEQAAHWFTINHITFSPDGRFFATASRDKTIKIWDAATFQLLKVADVQRDNGHINSVNRLLWLPENLVSCSDDRSVMIWEWS